MCEPVTLLAVGTMAAGALQKAQAAGAAGEANAQTQEHNAVIDSMAAGDAIDRGRLVAGRALMSGAKVEGQQQAGYAAANVDTQSGSAVDVQGDTGGLSAFDALTAQSNASRTAWGYLTDADNRRFQARVDRAEGSNEEEGAILGGLSSIAQYGAKLKAG